MKEIKISFEVSIAIKQTDVHWIEEELLQVRQEVFMEILKQVMSEIEEDALKQGGTCRKCESKLVRNGSEPKKISTLLGAISYRRVRLRCKRCNEDIYPLDKALGLEGGERMSIGVKERSLWTAVEVSYEKGSKFLKKFSGLEVSSKKIHTTALEEGKRIQQWEDKRRRRVFERGEDIDAAEKKTPEVLYIQVDGTGVNDRASGQWMECKVGTSFSERVLISKDRVWLMDKKSYASIENTEAFGEKFFLDCVKQGVLEAKTVYFIADGAQWIRNLKNNYFPNTIGILDIWHVEREMKKALGKEKEAVVGKLKGFALAGKPKEIILRLQEERLRTKVPEKREKIADAIRYVKNNFDWITNIPILGGYGSGPVEKTVDITVARRFKKRGMSWYKGGANPLLRLRLLKLNGEWEAYWQQRKKEFARQAA